jgi:hypothetical protein
MIVEADMLARLVYPVAVAVGLALGAIGALSSPTTAIIEVGFGVVVGVMTALTASEIGPDDRRTAGADPRAGLTAGADPRAGLTAGAVTVGGWLALTGLVAVLGPASGAVILALLLAAIALTWRRLHRQLHRRLGPQRGLALPGRSPARRGVSRVSPRALPSAPEALATPQLCLAWQESYLALLTLPPGPARSQIVRVRERLLDELERRDPDGFTRWLDAGADAGSDPGRYLTTDP